MNLALRTEGARQSPRVDEFSDHQYWASNEGLTSELRFHNKLYYLVNSIGVAYRTHNLPDLTTTLRRLLYVDDYVIAEPFLSIYETGLVNATLFIAHACADRHLLDEGYRVVEQCQSLLEAKRERRSELGLPPRPDSECWYRSFGLLAELKWKGSSQQRDRLISPEQLVSEFNTVEQRCLDYLRSNPSQDPNRDERVKAGLGWYGLQVIKMVITWCPQLRDPMVERFNRIHGDILKLETGHFLAHRPAQQTNPWYWDLELFKWCICGPGSQDEAALCHQWRIDSARTTGLPADVLMAYRSASDRELQFLLERATSRRSIAAS